MDSDIGKSELLAGSQTHSLSWFEICVYQLIYNNLTSVHERLEDSHSIHGNQHEKK